MLRTQILIHTPVHHEANQDASHAVRKRAALRKCDALKRLISTVAASITRQFANFPRRNRNHGIELHRNSQIS